MASSVAPLVGEECKCEIVFATTQDDILANVNKKEVFNVNYDINTKENLEILKNNKLDEIHNRSNVIDKRDPDYVFVENYTDYATPSNNSFKSYMDINKITNTSSEQYSLKKFAYIDYETGIMMINSRYCIALGSGYTTEIGTNVDLIMNNGSVIKCIVGDIKNNKDTDYTNRQQSIDGSVTEFIVSTRNLPNKVRNTGNISDTCDELKGEINYVRVYEKGEHQYE